MSEPVTSETPLDEVELLRLQLRLTKDLREAARYLSPQQQRILVDLYYQIQDNRIRLANQLRHAREEPNAWLTVMGGLLAPQEKLVAGALHIAAKETAVGRWALSIYGIGPVLAAGLGAHIDMTKTPSVAGLWRLAGLDPTSVWEKGQKRPWNVQLKKIRWLISDSFVKFHNREECFYGHIYRARKQLEVQRNEAGDFAALAAQTLATKHYRDNDTKRVYEQGKLPPGRLELRARRVAVKLFLSHYWEVAYYEHFGSIPPKPYVLAAFPETHTQFIAPPGYEHLQWA